MIYPSPSEATRHGVVKRRRKGEFFRNPPSGPSAAFSGDRGIRLAPRLAPAGEENPPQPPRPAGRVADRRTLRFAEGLIDAFFKKAWQKSRMQSHQIGHDWLGALLTV